MTIKNQIFRITQSLKVRPLSAAELQQILQRAEPDHEWIVEQVVEQVVNNRYEKIKIEKLIR